MDLKTRAFISFTMVLFLFHGNAQHEIDAKAKRFSVENDLLLAHYDCKTDVDDLHSIAAFATLLTQESYAQLQYHAVAGTYGIQEGPYVPPNELFQLAFGDHWSDAHGEPKPTLARVLDLAKTTLENNGDVWIAEAGQSDFSAVVIQGLQTEMPAINLSERVHIVQHSDWNEEVTEPTALKFVKKSVDYQKIPDGNALGNGTPGFQSAEYDSWSDHIKNPELIAIWEMAITLANTYNGKEGRYLNKSIAEGGLDFSDFSEVCWILKLNDIDGVKDFFERYGK